MQVKVNGQNAELETGMNLENLIRFYRLKIDQVVVEHNRKVPPKSAYAATLLQDGDEVEIVKFLGGG
ncbi:MAG: sulfur carrier protein ThiS [Fibrobacteres bacterium]|nr:sulfur carrier protein ThiS [Fibrobacterota bacterium]